MNPPAIEPMLRAAVEGASQGVLAVDPNGAIQWANPKAEAMFAYSPGGLTGQPLSSLIPQHLHGVHAAHTAKYFGEPRSRPMGVGLELTAVRSDGAGFPVEISLSHIVLPQGPLAIAFISDISARKRLQAERNRFFELSPDLICIVRPDGAFEQVNPAFTTRLGWTAEELLARPLDTFLHPDDAEKTRMAYERLLAGESLVSFTNRYVCKDGSVRWLEWSAPEASDQLIYAVARDVTTSKEAANAQQRLIALIENIPDFVALAATDGSRRILYVNHTGREMLGLPPLEQLLNMTEPDVAIMDAAVQAQLDAIPSGQGHWSTETHVYHYVTREAIPVDLTSFPVLFNGGGEAPVARALVARDTRERRRSQEQLRLLTRRLLRAQEEERRRIARDLHDDVTQKLAGLSIELGLLRRTVLPKAAKTKLLELQEQVASLAKDLRHLAHDLHPGILEHAGLGPAVKAFCDEVSRQRGIQIQHSVEDVPGEIPHDLSVVVYRITQEAVGNAVKHSGASQITVTLSKAGEGEKANRLRLTVADDGKGFELSAIEEGRSLGLLSMQERVHLVQGTLSIQSDPGRGTRLEVETPLP
jgi:PAS domain S-box-containing protein